MRDGFGRHSWFRKAEMLHLTLVDQVFHGSCDVFDRHVRVNTVLVEQIDDIGLESLEGGLGDFLDVFWPAIEGSPPGSAIGIRWKAELRCYHHPIAEWSKRFAHKFFICEWTVHFSGVEECDAAFESRSNQRNHFLLVRRRSVAKAHSHAAESERGDFQIALSKLALLHLFLLGMEIVSHDFLQRIERFVVVIGATCHITSNPASPSGPERPQKRRSSKIACLPSEAPVPVIPALAFFPRLAQRFQGSKEGLPPS